MRFLAALLLLPAFLLADDTPKDPLDPPDDTAKEETAPKEETASPEGMRIQLKNGSVLFGELAFPNIVIETAYGTLTVPATDVVKLRVGKHSDPDLLAEIKGLVADLGSDDAASRNRAQETLARMGSVAESELREASKSGDPEVKNRAAALVNEIENGSEDAAETLPDEDELVTVRFTVRGTLQLEKLDLNTSYGALSIPKKELRVITFQRSRHDSATVEISCEAGTSSPFNTKLLVHKGDKVTVKASGTISFRGGGWEIGPEGNSQYGSFMNNFPMGSLIGRIGSSANWFKVGDKWQGKAAKDGVLHLALAMNPEYLKMSSGTYEVTIEVSPEGE